MMISSLGLRPLVFFFTVLFCVAMSGSAFAARDGSTDRPGLDYKQIELSAPNPDLCEDACKKDSMCRAWTYSWPGAKGPKAKCALKTGVPPKRSDTCCISGVMSTSSPTTGTDDPKPEPKAPQKKPEEVAKPTPPAAPAQKTEAPIELPKPVAPEPQEPAIKTPERPSLTVTPKPKPEIPSRNNQVDEQTAEPTDRPSSEKVAACNSYADRAVAQNGENNRLGCGLTGSRWGYSRTVYYNYCLRSPSAAYNAARAARDRELAECQRAVVTTEEPGDDIRLPRIEIPQLNDLFGNDGRSSSFCRSFAAQSIQQAGEARALNCGFSGEAWSTSRICQARLCQRIGSREAAGLLNRRARQLDRCSRGAGAGNGGNHCEQYARIAISQAEAGRRLGCGFRGSRWTRNYRAHYSWCTTVSPRRADRETRIRDNLLARCE